ncbi:NMD3 family protein [Anopheles sinensis]|uniref:NMD3 family protein n=1 Tax=Anopheles sinensis TaxID=74873 RepID=A0A084VQA2_ANOSI|nr:NMD3 family protein [Anopheles sinensis]
MKISIKLQTVLRLVGLLRSRISRWGAPCGGDGPVLTLIRGTFRLMGFRCASAAQQTAEDHKKPSPSARWLSRCVRLSGLPGLPKNKRLDHLNLPVLVQARFGQSSD